MTIVGHHTVAELREWLAALDYQVGKIEEAYSAYQSHWRLVDRAAWEDWGRDWNVFKARYGAAHTAAQSVIQRAAYLAIPDSLLPVEDEWKGIHHALTVSPDGPYVKGDLQDLYNRLAAARGAPIDMSKMPQPTATDADLSVFNGTGAVLDAGKAAWDALPSPKLPDLSAITPSSGTKVLIGGGLLLGLVLVARSVTR